MTLARARIIKAPNASAAITAVAVPGGAAVARRIPRDVVDAKAEAE